MSSPLSQFIYKLYKYNSETLKPVDIYILQLLMICNQVIKYFARRITLNSTKALFLISSHKIKNNFTFVFIQNYPLAPLPHCMYFKIDLHSKVSNKEEGINISQTLSPY